MQQLLKTTYTYFYGVAVNPTSINIDQKNPFLVKKYFVDLPAFEMPDGSRPFKNFDFKDERGTRVMGSLARFKEEDSAKL